MSVDAEKPGDKPHGGEADETVHHGHVWSDDEGGAAATATHDMVEKSLALRLLSQD
jgi:hypothetical protein